MTSSITNVPLSQNSNKLEIKDLFERELYRLSQRNSNAFLSQQIFHIDLNCNFTSAYVTYEDICQLAAFQDQTVIAIKAPEETKLEVPTPTEVTFFQRNGKLFDVFDCRLEF